MKLLIFSLLLATCSIIDSQYVDVPPSEYAFDDQVKQSLDFGYQWIVTDLTDRDVIPRGDWYLAELNNVEKLERSDGVNFRFGAKILNFQKSRIEGSFTVYYQYPDEDEDDNIDEDEDFDDNNDDDNDDNEDDDDEDGEDDNDDGGPQRVIAYNYDYSYQIIDGEVVETEVNSFFPVEFVVSEDEEGEISVSILQPQFPSENEEEGAENVEQIVEVVEETEVEA